MNINKKMLQNIISKEKYLYFHIIYNIVLGLDFFLNPALKHKGRYETIRYI
mgnify:CR=1 FL=1